MSTPTKSPLLLLSRQMNQAEAFVYFRHGFGPEQIWIHHAQSFGTLSHISPIDSALEAADLHLYRSNLHKWHAYFLQAYNS